MSDLDTRLNAALERADPHALIPLYTEAAALASSARQRAFFLTHAMVHAFEAGAPEAERLRAQLVAMGCEEETEIGV